MTHSGLPVDLRIVPEEAFGNLLQHFTGSGKHNEALRTEAVRRGLHVSEYGITDDDDGETEAFTTEEEVYELLGMAYIPPELRENRGELEAARARRAAGADRARRHPRRPPHAHHASDGRNTIEEMVEGGPRARLRVPGDHRPLGHARVRQRRAAGRAAPSHRGDPRARRLDGIRVLAGTETNVLPDGSVDYDDDLLEQLDWVVASLHTSFRMSEKEMTERMLRAMEHPLVDVIGHPTGRLIGRREPYALDVDRVIEEAVRDRHLPRDQRATPTAAT